MATAMMIHAWRQKLVFFVVLLGTSFLALSQTIHYSRQTLPVLPYDKVQLLPNVSGTHHLLFLKRNAPLTVYRFDRDLQSLGATELPVVLADTCVTKVIPFKSFYLLYLHRPGSTVHQLWKVTAAGEATSLSGPFQRLVDSVFKKRTSALELINSEEQLAVVGNMYYDEAKAVATTIVTAGGNLQPLSVRTVSLPFEWGPNALHQEMLIGETLYILKSTSHTKNYTLELIKADLATGKLFRKLFQGKENFTRDAGFSYNPEDSTLLIQSSIGAEAFITKLDLSLNEVVPPTVLTPRYSNTIFTNFLLLDQDVQQWIVMSRFRARVYSATNIRIVSQSSSRQSPYIGWGGADNIDYNAQQYNRMIRDLGTPDLPYRATTIAIPNETVTPALRFLVADKSFKLLQDSVVTNKKSLSTVSATQFANITIGKKSYLVLKQDFPRKRKGLLLVSVDRNKRLSTSDITVFGKYDYLLQYAQSVRDGSLVMPYVHGSEMGLVKLSFAGMGQE